MVRTVEQLRESDARAREWGDRDAPKLLRMAAGERKVTHEAKVFTERADAVIHWTLQADSMEDLEQSVNYLLGLINREQFSAHHGFSNNGGGSRPRQRPPQQQRQNAPRQQQSVVSCALCGGETWDNRAKKASGDFKNSAPDYACKDKQGCAGIAWIKPNGELDWKVSAS